MQHVHEYRAVFTCANCRWDNDQTVEEDDAAKPAQKELAIDCWHCGASNEVVVKLADPE